MHTDMDPLLAPPALPLRSPGMTAKSSAEQFVIQPT
jgi:hypothetical protein